MKNDYEVLYNTVLISLRKRDGTIIKTAIDKSDFDLVNSINGRWSCKFDDKMNCYYVYYPHLNSEGRKTTTLLHRFLLNPASPKDFIDHIDHDTLNNTRDNIRIVTSSVNQHNRIKGNVNSRTGVRGVHWNKKMNRYAARITVRGKIVYNKYFTNIDDAEKSIKQERMKLALC